MKYIIYAIFDRVAGLFGEPFYTVSDELAIRRFNYLMGSSPMVASDCDLFRVGSYDSESGLIAPVDSESSKPVFVCRYEPTRSEVVNG